MYYRLYQAKIHTDMNKYICMQIQSRSRALLPAIRNVIKTTENHKYPEGEGVHKYQSLTPGPTQDSPKNIRLPRQRCYKPEEGSLEEKKQREVIQSPRGTGTQTSLCSQGTCSRLEGTEH